MGEFSWVFIDLSQSPSGSLAGPGSYLGLSADGTTVITASGGGSDAVTEFTNGAADRIVTAVSADSINAEGNLRFNGSLLSVTGAVSVSADATFLGNATFNDTGADNTSVKGNLGVSGSFSLSGSSKVGGTESTDHHRVTGSVYLKNNIIIAGDITGSLVSGSGLTIQGNVLFGGRSGSAPSSIDTVNTTGSFKIFSGSTPVFTIDNQHGPKGDGGRMLGKQIHVMNHAFNLGSRNARFIPMAGTLNEGANPSFALVWIVPYDTRLIRVIMASSNFASTTRCVLRLHTGSILGYGTTGGTQYTQGSIGQATASAPGKPNSNRPIIFNFEDSIDMGGGQGGSPANKTGSFSASAGSTVGIELESTAANFNDVFITSVWEFDLFKPFISGSGNN